MSAKSALLKLFQVAWALYIVVQACIMCFKLTFELSVNGPGRPSISSAVNEINIPVASVDTYHEYDGCDDGDSNSAPVLISATSINQGALNSLFWSAFSAIPNTCLCIVDICKKSPACLQHCATDTHKYVLCNCRYIHTAQITVMYSLCILFLRILWKRNTYWKLCYRQS